MAMAMSVRCAYSFVLGPLSEQEQKTLAAAFSAARKTANSWKAVDMQQLARECTTRGGALDAKRLAWLKPLVRRGIPVELRPTLWPLLSGGAARQAAAGPKAYEHLAASARASLSHDTQLTLMEDLSAGVFTFRSHPVFKAPGGLATLQRLVSAYLVHNPGGYFRGLAHVAGFLLIVLGGPAAEEAAFWTLAGLLEDRLFPYCAGQVAYGLQVEARLLDSLVERKMPRVASHLATLGAEPSLLTRPWLSSLFTTALPSEVAARVFDALLLEGSKVALRTSLALLKTFEAAITASSHPGQLRNVLDARTRRLYEPDALLATAFSGLGGLPTARCIRPARVAAAAAVDAQLAEQAARIESILGCRTH